MKYEAVIFDWAGTTVDYGCFAPVQAFLDSFHEYGIDPTMEEVRGPMGMLKIDHIRTMLQGERISGLWKEKYGRDWTEEDVHAVYELSEKKLLENLPNFADPKPYVIETVKELREMGMKIGSTTGYTDDMMAIVAPKAKELGYEPDCWFSPNAVGNHGRPYPYMIFKNMEALGLSDVRKVIKVGDTVSDIKEGKNAGMEAVGILEGSSVLGLSKEKFDALSEEEKKAQYERAEKIYKDAGADYVILDIRGILDIAK